MHDHRIDRGASALGVFFILIGLIAVVWIANGADPAAFAAAAPYLGPILVIGFGFIVIVMAVSSDGGRQARATSSRSSSREAVPEPESFELPIGDADHADVEIAFGAGRPARLARPGRAPGGRHHGRR